MGGGAISWNPAPGQLSLTPSTHRASQRIMAAVSFLPSDLVQISLLANSHMEPHEKGDAGKWSSSLAKGIQNDTIRSSYL